MTELEMLCNDYALGINAYRQPPKEDHSNDVLFFEATRDQLFSDIFDDYRREENKTINIYQGGKNK